MSNSDAPRPGTLLVHSRRAADGDADERPHTGHTPQRATQLPPLTACSSSRDVQSSQSMRTPPVLRRGESNSEPRRRSQVVISSGSVVSSGRRSICRGSSSLSASSSEPILPSINSCDACSLSHSPEFSRRELQLHHQEGAGRRQSLAGARRQSQLYERRQSQQLFGGRRQSLLAGGTVGGRKQSVSLLPAGLSREPLHASMPSWWNPDSSVTDAAGAYDRRHTQLSDRAERAFNQLSRSAGFDADSRGRFNAACARARRSTATCELFARSHARVARPKPLCRAVRAPSDGGGTRRGRDGEGEMGRVC